MSEGSGMRYYVAVPVFLAAFLLQTTLLWRLPVFGFSPNLLLVLVAVFSFLYEEHFGLILGIIFGLLLDAAVSPFFGMQALSFVLVYIIVRLLRMVFNPEKVLPDVLMCVIATIIGAFIPWIIYVLCGLHSDIINVIRSLPVLIIMQAVLGFILHMIFVRSIIRYRSDRKFKGGYSL
jgi:rod shape-determining protein MreD